MVSWVAPMVRVGTSILPRSTRAVPVQQGAAEAEFARTLHRNIDRRVDVCQRSLHRIRPFVEGETADVQQVVVLHEELLVLLRIVGVALRPRTA